MKFLSRLLYDGYRSEVAKYILWATYNYDHILKHHHMPGYLPYGCLPNSIGNAREVWKRLHAF